MNCPRCETEIDEHEANRCLDAWVAEAVMGWHKFEKMGSSYRGVRMCKTCGRLELDNEHWNADSPNYSSDIADAWKVAGKMTGPNMGVGGDWWKLEWLAGSYRANFGYGRKVKDVTYWKAIADTAPLAICRAALKASGLARSETAQSHTEAPSPSHPQT